MGRKTGSHNLGLSRHGLLGHCTYSQRRLLPLGRSSKLSMRDSRLRGEQDTACKGKEQVQPPLVLTCNGH